jgi:hypothetical protein
MSITTMADRTVYVPDFLSAELESGLGAVDQSFAWMPKRDNLMALVGHASLLS